VKKDVVDNTDGLSIINQVRVRNFKYKQYNEGSPVTSDDTIDMSEFPNATDSDGNSDIKKVLTSQGVTGTQIGCIAQELESILPNSVDVNKAGVKSVVTDELFWHMINAIKELSAEVEQLKSQLNN